MIICKTRKGEYSKRHTTERRADHRHSEAGRGRTGDCGFRFKNSLKFGHRTVFACGSSKHRESSPQAATPRPARPPTTVADGNTTRLQKNCAGVLHQRGKGLPADVGDLQLTIDVSTEMLCVLTSPVITDGQSALTAKWPKRVLTPGSR